METQAGKILVVDDNEDALMAVRLLLRKHVAAVHTEQSPDNIPNLMAAGAYDVILLDMNFTKDVSSGREGLNWLKRILEIDPAAVVIMITAYGDVEIAVESIKAGATDFVMKPWQNEKLLATVLAALRLRQSRREVDDLRQRQRQLSADLDQPYHDFIGTCPAMQQVFAQIDKVASTDASVLILGENGTGKELVAREIHRRSQRAEEVFINVDVGAITESLFESEFFGHVKGAFTDARDDRAGRFEIASGGTLFLDEIGNLPSTLQAKLLTTIEKRQVTRVGSNTARPIDIRLISATNHDIHKAVGNGHFRQDLLYRINTVELHLPPLRERGEDIQKLAEFFLARFKNKYGKKIGGISPAAVNLLQRYHWPGNVRELQHVVERAVIMTSSNILQPADFVLSSPRGRAKEDLSLRDFNLEQVEKAVIVKALDKHQGNITQAARELGLTRTSLYRRMEKHGL
jgi:DNA-binding NtrC family response regulator